MKIDLILTDPLYNVRRKLKLQIPNYGSFIKDYIADMVGMCDDYLTVGVHSLMLRSTVQISSMFRAVFTFIDSISFKSTKVNQQEGKETMTFKEKRYMLLVNEGWNKLKPRA